MNDFLVVNIQDLIQQLGDENVLFLLNNFSAPKNKEIEKFIHERALDFVHRKLAVTYIVLDTNGDCAAYFTLANKALEFPAATMSQSTRKRIERYSKFNEESGSYIVPAFLLAQFGKNNSYNGEQILSGNTLMDFVFEVVSNIQYMIGGGILYLECEDNKFLLDFYQNSHNGFHLFGERKSDSGTQYKLLYKFI
ncbi:hypothetical protein [Treponema sp.]|uniref:hypothetical protein n=1 Tax=Treponema sp. TaxID=166 RepID=UPI0025FC34CE|nr:hypothetical protein [Treponema sp.]MBR4322593.1 hypothetical protein [Treponema sp.]